MSHIAIVIAVIDCSPPPLFFNTEISLPVSSSSQSRLFALVCEIPHNRLCAPLNSTEKIVGCEQTIAVTVVIAVAVLVIVINVVVLVVVSGSL